MAKVIGTIHLAGQHVYVQAVVELKSNYPDSINEAKANVRALLEDELALAIALQSVTDDDSGAA